MLNAQHVGDASPHEEFSSQAQRAGAGPRLNIYHLKAVGRCEVKHLEEVGDKADDESCGGAVGDDNMRPLVTIAMRFNGAGCRVKGKGVEGFDGGPETSEGRCEK